MTVAEFDDKKETYWSSTGIGDLLNNVYFLLSVLGLQKAKEYDWKDSNMALFGSDVEKNIKSKIFFAFCLICF